MPRACHRGCQVVQACQTHGRAPVFLFFYFFVFVWGVACKICLARAARILAWPPSPCPSCSPYRCPGSSDWCLAARPSEADGRLKEVGCERAANRCGNAIATPVQGYNRDTRGTGIQGYRDTRVQGYKGIGVQGYRDTRAQRYSGTGIQGYRDTRAQRYSGTGEQRRRSIWSIGVWGYGAMGL